MNKKKKSLFERMLEFQAKPLKILLRETTKGVKEGLKEEEKEKMKCPTCEYFPLFSEFRFCPHCGVLINKFPKSRTRHSDQLHEYWRQASRRYNAKKRRQ